MPDRMENETKLMFLGRGGGGGWGLKSDSFHPKMFATEILNIQHWF